MIKHVLVIALLIGFAFAVEEFKIPDGICRLWSVMRILIGAVALLVAGIGIAQIVSSQDDMGANNGKKLLGRAILGGVLLILIPEILFYIYNAGRLCGL